MNDLFHSSIDRIPFELLSIDWLIDENYKYCHDDRDKRLNNKYVKSQRRSAMRIRGIGANDKYCVKFGEDFD
jgi:hypothetical protein